MAVAGAVNLLFKANTKSASGKIAKLGKVLGGVKTVAFGVAASIAGAGIAVSAMAAKVSENIRQQERWADSLGITGSRLAAMQKIAAGVGEEADTMTQAIADVSERIGDAASGSKPFQETLTAIGLKYQDLMKLSPDKQFFKVSEALSKMDNESSKAFRSKELSEDLFKLMSAVDQYGGSMEGAVEKIESLKTSLTGLERQNILSTRKSFDEFSLSAGAAMDKIMVAISPLVVRIMNGITKIIDYVISKIDSIKTVISKVAVASQALQDSIAQRSLDPFSDLSDPKKYKKLVDNMREGLFGASLDSLNAVAVAHVQQLSGGLKKKDLIKGNPSAQNKVDGRQINTALVGFGAGMSNKSPEFVEQKKTNDILAIQTGLMSSMTTSLTKIVGKDWSGRSGVSENGGALGVGMAWQ